jgi:hypothetical protein
MALTETYILENKNKQLLRMVNFYERQIVVLDEMLSEIAEKYICNNSEEERKAFHQKFLEKQYYINELKHEINVSNYLLMKGIKQNNDQLTERLIDESKHIENDIISFEKEINELSRDFKLFVINEM